MELRFQYFMALKYLLRVASINCTIKLEFPASLCEPILLNMSKQMHMLTPSKHTEDPEMQRLMKL